MPDEPGFRHEVLEGALIREPSPSVRHQRVSTRLQEALRDYFRTADPDGEVLSAPLDVVLSDNTVVQPDLLYIPGSDAAVFAETHVFVAPRLVVEILSPATASKDRLQKMEIYRKAGIEHYWIADPDANTLEAFALRDSYYARVAAAAKDDILTHPGFPGLEVPAAHIFPQKPPQSSD